MPNRKTIIKTPEQIRNIRESWKYLTELLQTLYRSCQPGTSLLQLEHIAQQFCEKHKLKGAFKWYHGYPNILCTSVDDCVVHGIPTDKILQQGELLKVDCGLVYNGAISDSAFSIVIGGDHTNTKAAWLVEATKASLDGGLARIAPHKTIYDYSCYIYDYMNQNGYSVIMPLTGHGVGTMVHEAPYIYNYPHPDTKKTRWKPGMVVALEPITAITSTEYKESPDPSNDWDLYTKNNDLGAQREYMILITENGYEVLSWLTEIP